MKANLRIRNWQVPCCLLACIGLSLAVPDNRICTSVDPDCEGNILDCSRSIVCHHGDCDGRGACLCQACWRGEHCNEYVDVYSPKFLVKSKYVALSAYDSGVLFVAEAVDEDASMTCHFDDVVCPCSSIRYSIHTGNEYDLFTINSQSGQVYVSTGAHLTMGVEYTIVIRASSLLTDLNATSASRRTHDDMQVTVRIDEVMTSNSTHSVMTSDTNSDDVVDDSIDDDYNFERRQTHVTESVMRDEEDNHVRRKRAAEGETAVDTIMTLTKIEPTVDDVALWSKVLYKLEILLPKITDMDLLVELFTNDPETKNSTFRICGAKVSNVGSKVTSDLKDLMAIEPEMKLNIDGIFEDRAIFNFSKVSNTENTDNKTRNIEITFAAVLIRTPALQNNAKYYITAGAEYDNENFVWVGQSEMVAKVPADDDAAFETTFKLAGDGPDSIAEEESGVYTILLGNTYPSENLILDVFSPDDNYIDLFSVGNLRLKDAGDNFPCIPKDKMVFPMTFYTSETGKSKYRGTLNMTSIQNCANDRANPDEASHLLTLEFAIYVLKGTKDIIKDGNLTFATGLLIGQKTIWTAITNITVNPFNENPSNKGKGPEVKLIQPVTDTKMPEKGVTMIRYELGFEDKTFTDTKLTVTIPDTGEMSLCSIQIIYRGFNIPFVPVLKYKFKAGSTVNTSVEAEVDLGRIQTTGQLTDNATANTLLIDIGLRSVTGFTDKQLKLQDVASSKISTETAEYSSDVTLVFNDRLSTDVLFLNGETGIDMEFTFPVGSPYDPFSLEVMGQFGDNVAAARICRVEVTSVGRLLPCVNQTQLNLDTEYTTTMDTVQWDDRAIIPFERLCVSKNVGEELTPKDSKMVVNFVAEMPKQDALKTGSQYWLNAGIKMGNESVLAGSIKYDVKAANKGTFADGFKPIFEAYAQEGDGPLVKGSKYVFFRFKLPSRTRADYKLSMSLSDAGASICSMKALHVGHNMPCVVRKIYAGNKDPAVTTTITYTPTDATETTYYTNAELDFGSLANVGVDPLITSRRNDRNTIFVGTGIHVTDKNKEYTIKYEFTYGEEPVAKGDIVLKMGPDPTPGTFKDASMGTVDGTNKNYDEVTTVVYVDFQFPAYVTTETVEVTFTKKSGAEELDFCSASLTYVGSNMPCVDVRKSTFENEGPEKLVLKVGKVCHANAFEDPEASRIRVEMAFNSPDKSSPTIQAEVNVDGVKVTAEVALATSTDPPPKARHRAFIESHISFPSKPDELKVGVSKKAWIPVKLAIPTNATLKFNVTVEGAYENNRAVITVYDVKVGEAGINVACLRNGSLLEPELTKSADVTTQSQNNVMKVDFGYITNTGFTDKLGVLTKADNEVTVWFLVRMTDHPSTENNAVFPLTINVQLDDTVVTAVQNLTATRDGKEKEEINFVVNFPDKKETYNKDDTFTLNILISHTEASSLEPTVFYLRVLAPPYLGYSSHKSNMTNVIESKTSYIQLELKDLLYDDSISVDLVLAIDPKNTRKPGSPPTTGTSMVRGICKVSERTGLTYPKGFHYCTDQSLISVSVGAASGCEGDLTSIIQDCQLSASSGMDDDSMPPSGRTNQDKFWSPAFRLGKLNHHYQVDFGNLTQVISMKMKKSSDVMKYQPITSFGLKKSNNGRIWKDVKPSPLTPVYDANHIYSLDLSKDNVQTRYLRIETLAPQYGTNADPCIAAQFEFHGCAVGGGVKAEEVCAQGIATRNSNNPTQYRHFAVDEKRNAMYFCDYIHLKDKMNCFCSENQGKSWQGLPANIGRLIGYDTKAGAVYAIDKKERAYMKSTTCKKWPVIKDKNTATGSDVKVAQVVPAMPEAKVTEVKVGDWAVNFMGIKYGPKQVINWSICCK